MVIARVVKPKTKRGKRFLENRESKVVENVKKCMFIKGGKTNECVTTALKNLYCLKKPFSLMLAKKNILRPFDDQNPLEYLAKKNDHSLFVFGSNSKKRANSLVFGRLFDNQIMDMFELGIECLKPLEQFKVAKVTQGVKPCLVFTGEAFAVEPEYMRLKCLLADFFRGEEVENLRLQGVEHVISITALDAKIYFRSYRTVLKKSGTRVPNIELEEIGPSMNLVVRRSKLGSDDLYREAKRQPKEIVPKKKKNVTKDAFGSTLGRIHMQKQDLSKLQLRKLNAFKRSGDQADSSGSSAKKTKNDSADENNNNDEQTDE